MVLDCLKLRSNTIAVTLFVQIAGIRVRNNRFQGLRCPGGGRSTLKYNGFMAPRYLDNPDKKSILLRCLDALPVSIMQPRVAQKSCFKDNARAAFCVNYTTKGKIDATV
jgi:hypothetical protein